MSAIKASQVHDGFATIRSRGLQRSRSRVEQLERLKPMSMKCDSLPLYENPHEIISVHNNNNNNNIIAKNANIANGTSAMTANDHQVVYHFESFSGVTESSPTTEALQNEAKMLKTVDEIELSTAKNVSCGTFKCSSNGQLSISDNGGGGGGSSVDMNDRSSLPPPSPCYETFSNGYHSPKTPPDVPVRNSATLSDYFLYSRPTSPLYESYASLGLSANGTTASSSPEAMAAHDIMYSSLPPTSKLFTTSYYTRNDAAAGEYALQKLSSPKKPALNFKTQSLQYRKSYSHPAQTIYENTTTTTMPIPGAPGSGATNSSAINKYDHGIRNYYNSTTNYYDPSEMSYISSYGIRQSTTGAARTSDILIPKDRTTESSTLPKPNETLATSTRNNFTRRPYATLAHPKDTQRRLQRCQSHIDDQRKYGSNELNGAQTDFDYLDPLDCKIGCQTTLRSKPQIPWYELAIKKDNRRQSCPPMQAHLVSAFEQSLSTMTQKLQQLSATADRKDTELMEMRQTIELLRKQSIQAGLTSAHIQSMTQDNDTSANRLSGTNSTESTPSANGVASSKTSAQSATAAMTNGGSSASDLLERHLSSDSMCSLNSISSGCSTQDKNNKKKTGWLRTSFKKAFTRNAKLAKNGRYVSVATTLEQIPSSHSINLNSSNESAGTNTSSSLLPPPSPTKASPHRMMPVVENAKPIDAIEEENNPVVEDLKKQLREKDLVLTDIRLEALSSASQLESLKDTVNKMRQEMLNLKQNNERLQKMVTSRSLAGSEVSLGNNGPLSPNGSIGEPRRYSLADGNLRAPLELPKSLDETEEEDIPPAPAPEPDALKQSNISPTHSHLNGNHSDHLSTPAEEIPEDQIDGKKISIVVYLGQPETFNKYAEELLQSENEFFEQKIGGDCHENGFEKKQKSFSQCSASSAAANEFIIAFTYISGKTTWQNLDYIVRKTFKDYLARIDPGTNLGLNTDSITSYHLGEAKRGPEIGYPELLPCGYIVGNVRSLYICLQDVGSLAFDSLIPRSIVQRYINLLTDHRRLILCGPSGTGKSYLARKLAEFLVSQSQRDNPNEAIATFNVDHKSSEELQHYLGHIAAQASMANEVSELPSVIILDNLHHASALGDVFQVLLSAGPASKLPCIIGTMSQATCNTTNLQLHHNFRWLLTANHMEPVKGFLARFLRRRLFQLELSTNTSQPLLGAVFTWLPTVWQHINRFLETHSSSDVTIGPRLFLSCPLDLTDAQVWFTDVWNYHLAPYLLEAVREGVQLYGRRGGAWIDPVTFVRETYPWAAINGTKNMPPLRQINAEDVGLEGSAANGTDSQDPLLNMLIRLQEAANYTSNPEQESDCASIDSNVTLDSASEKLEAA